MTAIVADSDKIADDGLRFLMSPDERRAFLRPRLAGNREICRRYGLDEPFFCSDEIPEEWSRPEPISSKEWAGLAADVALHLKI